MAYLKNLSTGKKIMAGIVTLCSVCCVFSLIVGVINAGLRSAGILPTSTPRRAAPATLVPVAPLETTAPTEVVVPTATPIPASPTPDIGNEAMAQVMCEKFVTNRLKSPSTADFGGFLSNRTKAVFIKAEAASSFEVDLSALHNTGIWVANGSVDAQNSFGAIIRSKFTCVMDYERESGQWLLLDISIGQ